MLTFVDMSKLKYLSRSVKTHDTLSRKKAQIALPKNTGIAIMEAASEEDSDGANDQTPAESTDAPKTAKDFADEILNELIGIVIEAEGGSKTVE